MGILDRFDACDSVLAQYLAQFRANLVDMAPVGHKRRRDDAGIAYWIEGPSGLDANDPARRAAEASILIEPGDVHFQVEKSPKNFFRLGFSSISVDRIEPGIKLIGEILRK